MLTEQQPALSRYPAPADIVQRVPAPQPAPRRAAVPRLDGPRIAAFVSTAALVVLYALRGGAYDLVAFTEYGIVIWSLIGVGFAVGLLPRRRPSRAVLVFASLLLAYAIWTAASLTWSASSERTTVEVARVLDYLGLVVLLATALDTRTWRPAAAGLGFGALLVSALALGSRLVPAAFPADAVTSALHFDRLSYPLGYWNAIAAWGAMSTTFGLAWSAHDESRAGRALALGLVPFAVAATYLTYSRAGVAGTALGVVAVFAFSRNRLTVAVHAVVAAAGASAVILAIRGAPAIAHATGSQGAAGVIATLLFAAGVCTAAAAATGMLGVDRKALPRAVARTFGAIGMLVVLLPAIALGPRELSRSWHSFSHPHVTQSSDPAARLVNLSGSRYLVWKSALRAFSHHPMTGTGAGTFAFWWNQHATDYEFLRDTHNIWLQNLAELGVPGALLIVAVAIAALAVGVFVRRRARRRSSAGAAAAFISMFIVYLLHATVDWMWESTAVTVLAIAGLSTISIRLGRAPGATGWPIRAAVTLGAVIVCGLQVPGLLSTLQIRRSQAAERSGKTSLALGWANDAVSSEPWSASALEQRALVRESAGDFDLAARDLRSATRREPTNYVPWLLLARVETEQANFASALTDYRQAHDLRPLSAAFVYAPYFRTR